MTDTRYVGKDQQEVRADTTPIERSKGYTMLRPPKAEPTEEEQLVQELQAVPNENLTAEEKTFKKRYGDLRRFQQEKDKEWKVRLNDLEGKLNEATAQPRTPILTEEELESIRDSNPESFDAIRAIARKEDEGRENRLIALEKRLVTEETEKLREKALRVIATDHPDWDDIRLSEGFHTWAGLQEPDIQKWVYDNETNGRLASKAISMYKSERGVKPKKQDKVDASRMVRTNTTGTNATTDKKIWTRAELNKMPQDEYEKNETAIKLARKEGRIQ